MAGYHVLNTMMSMRRRRMRTAMVTAEPATMLISENQEKTGNEARTILFGAFRDPL